GVKEKHVFELYPFGGAINKQLISARGSAVLSRVRHARRKGRGLAIKAPTVVLSLIGESRIGFSRQQPGRFGSAQFYGTGRILNGTGGIVPHGDAAKVFVTNRNLARGGGILARQKRTGGATPDVVLIRRLGFKDHSVVAQRVSQTVIQRQRMKAIAEWQCRKKTIIIIAGVHHHAQAQLPKVAHVLGSFRAILGLGEDRQQNRRQNRDDRDHDQQLDQGESAGWKPFAPGRLSGEAGIF